MGNKTRFCKTCILVFLAFLASCTSTLTTEYIDSPTYDVSKLKTWSWGSDKPITMIGFLVGNSGDNVRGNLLSTTTDELNKRGYQRVDRSDNPDFHVSFLVGAVNQSRTSVHRSNPSGLVQEPTLIWTQSNDYLEGGVSVVLRNPVNDEIMWQGIARDKLGEREMRGLGKTTVTRLVRVVMENFPASNR